ncbi:MAG: DUF302 domain-containing protein [Roseobacter sp.]
MRYLFAISAFLAFAASATASDLTPRSGWMVLPTQKEHSRLLADLKSAVKAHKMGVVTQAGPTSVARKRGIEIPENRVVGVFNNDFAVKILALSTAAMIEAPIRFYVTENEDKTATLSYKTPTTVFAPYRAEGGDPLAKLVAQLDVIFDKIARAASQ